MTLTLLPDPDPDLSPKREGFWDGLRAGRDDTSTPIPNPHQSRGKDREVWVKQVLWTEGYTLGRRLGRLQRQEVEHAYKTLKA